MTLAQATADYHRVRRVRRGIDLLDEHGPSDWRERIDVESLEMANVFSCVIGQVFGAYSVATLSAELGLDDDGTGFGFETDCGESYHELTNAWQSALTD